VCGIWEEVLKRERVGVEENFFEIGGHSLLATQVVSRIRQVFGVELALRVMFEHPTVGSLTEVLNTESNKVKAPEITSFYRDKYRVSQT
jgi:hypothetical protein